VTKGHSMRPASWTWTELQYYSSAQYFTPSDTFLEFIFRERQTEAEPDIKTERQRQRETEKDRESETEKDREREREAERDRERQRQSEREKDSDRVRVRVRENWVVWSYRGWIHRPPLACVVSSGWRPSGPCGPPRPSACPWTLHMPPSLWDGSHHKDSSHEEKKVNQCGQNASSILWAIIIPR
jgi:hypothetical protein